MFFSLKGNASYGARENASMMILGEITFLLNNAAYSFVCLLTTLITLVALAQIPVPNFFAHYV